MSSTDTRGGRWREVLATEQGRVGQGPALTPTCCEGGTDRVRPRPRCLPPFRPLAHHRHAKQHHASCGYQGWAGSAQAQLHLQWPPSVHSSLQRVMSRTGSQAPWFGRRAVATAAHGARPTTALSSHNGRLGTRGVVHIAVEGLGHPLQGAERDDIGPPRAAQACVPEKLSHDGSLPVRRRSLPETRGWPAASPATGVAAADVLRCPATAHPSESTSAPGHSWRMR